MAVIIAVGVNTDGRRKILRMEIGVSEAATFWMEFLRKLALRGPGGVKLVISNAQVSIKAAVSRVFGGSIWQGCRLHFIRSALVHAGKT